jgi:hypothetical protein
MDGEGRQQCALEWRARGQCPYFLVQFCQYWRSRCTVGVASEKTGVLALDCGHCDFPYTSCHDCADNDAEPNNLEIHPVYSVDVLQDFRLPRPRANLSGVWAADDVGTYYVRQVGDTVWWLGLSHDRGQTFANVFQGTIQRLIPLGPGVTVQGDWADIPLGGLRGNGSLKLHGQPFLGTSPTTLDKQRVLPVALAREIGKSFMTG